MPISERDTWYLDTVLEATKAILVLSPDKDSAYDKMFAEWSKAHDLAEGIPIEMFIVILIRLAEYSLSLERIIEKAIDLET